MKGARTLRGSWNPALGTVLGHHQLRELPITPWSTSPHASCTALENRGTQNHVTSSILKMTSVTTLYSHLLLIAVHRCLCLFVCFTVLVYTLQDVEQRKHRTAEGRSPWCVLYTGPRGSNEKSDNATLHAGLADQTQELRWFY